MNPKISIIILNWNGFEDTLECLASLKKIDYKNYDVIVVDNNSTGNDVEIITKKFGDFIKKIIVSEDNLGFSGGNNLGIKFALDNDTDFVLLLNNDTILEKDFLGKLVEIFERNKKIGISAPQINYYSRPNIIWSIGGEISKIRGSGFAYSDEDESSIEVKDRNVTFASGCCLLIKKEVFEKVGLLDDKFFLYVEDTDFCYRTIQAGYKIIVTPNSKIYHKVGNSTSEELKEIPLYYTTRNRLYFAKKNFQNLYFVTIIYIFFTMLFKSFFWLIKGKRKNINSIFLAFQDFIKGDMGKIRSEKFSVLK